MAHCALICGQTGCGKTVYVLDLLATEYRNVFDDIVIFCPTYNNNVTYHSYKWVQEDENILVIDPKDKLDECLKRCFELYKKSDIAEDKHTLFIIDDCSASSDIHKKRQTLSELAFSGRHDGISVWVITQKYNSVLKDFREQTKWVALFCCKDKSSFDECLEENDVIESKEEKIKIKKMLKQSNHAKLILKTSPPYSYEIIP